ncbi:FMN-binding negative transcriptional regulator [Marinomonas atlantica]|uniref:FMN-binding negative transcriptional regulator n=1 Tax=Marinomonas atlantica TaxID=1806668 RepID=UPI00082DD52E|nr:FMN-binding negative transcriptional regulator [Marinomonas atlantica]
MYTPASTELTESVAIAKFIEQFGFGLIVSPTLEATHLPLILKPEEGELGCLYGHFAKANGHWQQVDDQRVLVVFNGPHSYISPSWYQTNPAVPTWNYAAVHCYGVVELLSEQETSDSMDELVSKYEPELLSNNQLMPSEYKARLTKAVVGFRIVLDDIQAKEKLGQHRKPADQTGVYQALLETDSLEAQQLANYMQSRQLGIGE